MQRLAPASRSLVMHEPIRNVVILGGGSAGWLAAITFRRIMPDLNVTVVQSANVPVIGVGESTTAFIPHYLHNLLGLDRKQFHDEVKPSWKLGIKFFWGDPCDTHFHYPFDDILDAEAPGTDKRSAFFCLDGIQDASHFYALMDRDRAPCLLTANGTYHVNEGFGYHIPNKAFLDYLQRKSVEFGAKLIEGDVSRIAKQRDGSVKALHLADGRVIGGDLFVDASGFKALLIDGELHEPTIPYTNALFCDTAVIGSWQRAGPILPYTTAETMEHGWAWRIEFLDQVTRGYVFSSAFATVDEATAELKTKNPELTGDLRTLRFTSGRRQRYWVKNVAAIGNAAGFVEPLEATALHMILEQVWSMTMLLRESNAQPAAAVIEKENSRYANLWDEVRDFLAVHYKFNRRSASPFWQHCRSETPLGKAQALVDFYAEAGPSRMCEACIPPGSIFGYRGYLTLLVGQRVTTHYRVHHREAQLQAWERYRETIRRNIANTLPVRESLQVVTHPHWQWPQKGA